MAIDTHGIRAQADLVKIIGARVQLRPRGHEYIGLCPFHQETTPSFTVVPAKGLYQCFGCGANGDAIEFIMAMDGLTFKDACTFLITDSPEVLPMKQGRAVKPVPRPTWTSEVPPQGLERPDSFSMPGLGEPVATWAYCDRAGTILGYVARYEVTEAGRTRKVTPMWSYGTDNPMVESRWDYKAFSKPRPLYGLQYLATGLPILLTEGEKTCEAARILFPGYACLSWPGGTNGVQHVDWSPLFGQAIILIPDHDAPGRKAMDYIASIITTHGGAAQIATIDDRSKGWDLADALADRWTPQQATNWLAGRLASFDPKAPAPLTLVDDDLEAATEPVAIPPAFSDDALAEQFVVEHGADWRHVSEWGHWLKWDGRYWQHDKLMGVFALSRQLCREVVNYNQGSLLTESAKRSLTSSRTHASVVRVTSYDQRVAATVEQWDTDPWILSTPGGIVDLRTGQLRAARREDYQSKITHTTPEPGCPLWEAFLGQVTAGDEALQAYLQRLAGYLLTGVTTEQMLAFFYGTGGNGKGVFLRTIRDLMGDYALNASMDTFTEQKGERHETELAQLRGARFVTAQETDEGRKWAESRIKALTGGDPIRARFMRQDYFEFQPAFKLIFAGNHKPSLSTVDEAMRRRVHIVPFTVTIDSAHRDPLLDEKLKAEYPGILHWMIEGCLAWQQQGLCAPDAVTQATDEYLEAEDALQGWMDENCTLGETYETAVADVYRDYVGYCEGAKEHAWSKKRLTQNLVSRGMRSVKEYGLRTLKGIALKTEPVSETRW